MIRKFLKTVPDPETRKAATNIDDATNPRETILPTVAATMVPTTTTMKAATITASTSVLPVKPVPDTATRKEVRGTY